MEIQRYLALFIRWIWLVLLGAVIAGGTAYLISKNTTPVYRTSSRLLIDEAPGGSAGNDYSQILLEQRLAQTYVEIMTTRPVLLETIERLELPFTPEKLGRMLSVSAPQDTKIVVISVEDTDPLRAADIANTLGEVFISQTEARENLRYAEPIANWQERLAYIGD
jgi:non-specific protein-tyrosine kinase